MLINDIFRHALKTWFEIQLPPTLIPLSYHSLHWATIKDSMNAFSSRFSAKTDKLLSESSSVDRQELTAVESLNLKAQCSCKSTSDSTCTDYLLQLGLRGSTAFYSLSLPCYVITCASTLQQLDLSKEAARSMSSRSGDWCLVLRYNYTVEPHSLQKTQQGQQVNTQDRPERFFDKSSYSGRLNLWRLLLSNVWQHRMKGLCSVSPDKGSC